MEYQEFNYTDKNEIEKLLLSSNQEVKIGVILGMVNGLNDWKWVQDKLLSLIFDDDFWIAKNALTSLSDVARIHKNLEIDKVKRELDKVIDDRLKDVISDVYQDFNIFLNNSKK
jgi:hypothetical protein